MSREEKIQEAAKHYEQVDATNLACDYGWGDCDIQQQCFKAGAEWADQHPSVDTVKKIVCYALKRTNIMLADDLENGVEWELLIKKAMEE